MLKLPNKGICLDCCDYNDCLMPSMIKQWKIIIDQYGDDVREFRPDLWDEYSVDQPIIKNDEVEWCPMFCGK